MQGSRLIALNRSTVDKNEALKSFLSSPPPPPSQHLSSVQAADWDGRAQPVVSDPVSTPVLPYLGITPQKTPSVSEFSRETEATGYTWRNKICFEELATMTVEAGSLKNLGQAGRLGIQWRVGVAVGSKGSVGAKGLPQSFLRGPQSFLLRLSNCSIFTIRDDEGPLWLACGHCVFPPPPAPTSSPHLCKQFHCK